MLKKPYNITSLSTPQDIARLDNLLTTVFDLFNQIGFKDRGDPSAWDFQLANLTTNGTWIDLDLSSIIPVNTKAVLLHVSIADDAAGNYIEFRKNGNTNGVSRAMLFTQVSNIYTSGDLIVFCDNNRKIEYLATNTTFTGIYITVKGWFI